MTLRAKLILAFTLVFVVFFAIINLEGISFLGGISILTYLKKTDFPAFMEPTYEKKVVQSDPNKQLRDAVVRNNSVEEILTDDWKVDGWIGNGIYNQN